MWLILINGALFNVCWLLVVASQSGWQAWLLVLLVVPAHLYFFGRGWPEAKLVLLLSLGGFLLDQLLFASGLLRLAGEPGGAPLWLHALWPLFAITLLHAFAGLARHPLLAAGLGGAAGYGSYRLGAAMSAIEFGMPPLTDIALVLLWAALFPLLLIFAHKLAAGALPGATHADR